MAAIGGQTFDGGDFFAGDAGDRRDAGTRGLAVDVHGTSAAEGYAAAELRTGHVQCVAEHPEQRHVRADINGLGFAVQRETDGHGDLPFAEEYPTTNALWMKIRGKPVRLNAEWLLGQGGPSYQTPGNPVRKQPQFPSTGAVAGLCGAFEVRGRASGSTPRQPTGRPLTASFTERNSTTYINWR